MNKYKLYDPKTTYLCHDISIHRHLMTGNTARQPVALSSKDGNLPPLQQAGFFGRNRELGQIKKAFVQDGTRRVTLSGIGGQGKTYLAIKAGQRLYRTGMFQKVCFVDYATFFGVDAVGLAVRTLENVLDKELETAGAASHALGDIPTLLILDNVETIPPEPLRELLDVAKQWSEMGACRLLLTSRTADFKHPDYPTNNRLIHQSLPLSGLAKEDALAYFQRLLKLPPAPQVEPPKREELLKLFKQVAFHPLSIGMLASPLKVHRPAELEERLEALLAETPESPLWAALNVSLERLTLEIEKSGLLYWLARMFKRKTTKSFSLNTKTLRFLPILGVFQGGAFEPDLLAITHLPKKQWQPLRFALETVGLIQLEFLPRFRVPYIKFHPSLAPALWTHLSSEEQEKVFTYYQHRYAQLAGYMFYEEGKSTEQVRILVQRDLPNLLHAVHGALDTCKRGADKFADNIDMFFNTFGLKRDSAALRQRVKNAGLTASYRA